MNRVLIINSLASLACGIIVPFIVIGCGKKEPIEAPKVEESQVVSTMTPNEGMIAVLRQDPKSDQVCYDPNSGAYLIHFAKDEITPTSGEPSTNVWFYVGKVDFWQLSNGNWFTKDIEIAKYVRVWPVVTGLPCKLQVEVFK